jgi:hypothetical protein
VARVHHYVGDAGRDPASSRANAAFRFAGQEPEGWAKQVDAWKALGASYLIGEPHNGGLKFRDGHLDVLRTFRETVRS